MSKVIEKYKKENILLHSMCVEAFKKYYKIFDNISLSKTKSGPSDVVSRMDTEMDTLLNKKIKAKFPNDEIYSEEGGGDLKNLISSKKRIWILDPICGSLNVVRGINIAATNIILVKDRKVVAAWVYDYSRKRVIWSTGDNNVYIGRTKQKRLGKINRVSVLEVNKGYLHLFSEKYRVAYGKFIQKISTDKYTYAGNSGSSLAFTYVATGQFEAAVTFHVKSWDVLAACFLVEQNGGIVRNFDGTKWNLDSKSVILSGNKKIYNRLYNSLKFIGKSKINTLMK